jgi:hypothetical protein
VVRATWRPLKKRKSMCANPAININGLLRHWPRSPNRLLHAPPQCCMYVYMSIQPLPIHTHNDRLSCHSNCGAVGPS